MTRRLLSCLACLLLVATSAACGSDDSPAKKPSPADPGGDPGPGKDPGEDPGEDPGKDPGEDPGDDDPKPKPDPQPEPEPPVEWPAWEESRVLRPWTTQGIGDVYVVLADDFLGDGSTQVFLGGRRPALLRADGSELIWQHAWEAGENHWEGGDANAVWAAVPVPSPTGGADVLLSVGLSTTATLLRGSDGAVLWEKELDLEWGFLGPVIFGDPADPLFFSTYGWAAHSLRDGEERWKSPLAQPPTYLEAARLGEDQPTGLWALSELDVPIGGRPDGEAPLRLISASGEILATASLPAGRQPTAFAVADLDGDGRSSALIGLEGGGLRAVRPDGSTRWDRSWHLYGLPDQAWRTYLREILAHDLDGDGQDELFLIFWDENFREDGRGPATVMALDASGAELWRHDFDEHVREARIEVLGGRPTLLISSGSLYLEEPGELLALHLETEALDRVRLRVRPPHQVNSTAVVADAESETLVLASSDGILRAYDASTADAEWTHYSGSWIRGLDTFPGPDGSDWIVHGDVYGHIVVRDAEGKQRWVRRLQMDHTSSIYLVAAADFQGDGTISIVGQGYPLPSAVGHVELFDLDGNRKHAFSMQGEALAMAAADLDGSGKATLLIGESMHRESDHCSLIALDGELQVLWRHVLVACSDMSLSVGAVDGSGEQQIAIRTFPGRLPVSPTVTLLDARGERRWQIAEGLDVSLWVEALPGAVAIGGAALAHNGYVALLDPDTGERLWRQTFPPRPEKLNPGAHTTSNASAFGAWLPDLDGDGVPEIVTSTHANELRLLSGASGENRWLSVLEDTDVPMWLRHSGGHVLHVPEAEDAPAHLIHTQQDWSDSFRTRVFVLSMDGVVRDSVEIPSASLYLRPFRSPAGKHMGLVASHLGLHPIGLKRETSDGN